MAERTFTPSEANSALDRVAPLAARMAELATRVGSLDEAGRLASQIAARNGNGRGATQPGVEAGAPLVELERCLVELHEIGVEVRDLETGLLDFPALRAGEEVLLCWRLGEPSVGWWHRREEGFAGRRPIDWDDH